MGGKGSWGVYLTAAAADGVYGLGAGGVFHYGRSHEPVGDGEQVLLVGHVGSAQGTARADNDAQEVVEFGGVGHGKQTRSRSWLAPTSVKGAGSGKGFRRAGLTHLG